CNDENPCTQDSCDEAKGCVNEPDINKPCDDGDECTHADLCDASGKCLGKDQEDCDDNNPCTDDSCDPTSGDCSHEANASACDDGDPCTKPDVCSATLCVPGPPVPGCCHADPDCDDNDPCTIESCKDGTCAFEGEPMGESGTGCVPGGACQSGFCDSTDGGCDQFEMTMPRALLDWDLTSIPTGFRWTAQGGVFGQQGAQAAGAAPTAFRLPGHFAPAGIHVLYAFLGLGKTCQDSALVSVNVDGVQQFPADCRVWNGTPVLPFVWTEPAPSRIDVKVVLQPGAVLGRLIYYAWAASGCRPLGPVAAAPSADASDLALAGTPRGMMAGYRTGKNSPAVSLDLLHGLSSPKFTNISTFNPDAVWFSTSMAPLPDGRFLFAYGGADQEARLVLLGPDGSKVSAAVPSLFAPEADQQYEPNLAPDGKGGVRLAYASTQADEDGLGVVLTTVQVTGGQIGPFAAALTVNQTSEGDQRMPALDDGMVLWTTPSPQGWSVLARAVSPEGVPEGNEIPVHTSGPGLTLARLTAARSGDLHFVAWQASDGRTGGAVLDADLSKTASISLSGVGEGQYRPTLTGREDGALLVFTRVDGLDVNVVQAMVSKDGAVSAVEALSGQVNNMTASSIVTTCGPFMDCAGFVDTWSASDKGVYLGLTSGACANGPVDCTKPATPGVCTGFGPTGYKTFAGASGWCQQ
ncbi:MAG: hypothetical protein GXP54_06700, partial [Deltaproteobacteria bacterium]|nr:hypothetical protein [Deltaproteobacteria bacterium]